MVCVRATVSRAQQKIFWNYIHFSVKIAIFGRLEVGWSVEIPDQSELWSLVLHSVTWRPIERGRRAGTAGFWTMYKI